jgi:ATP-dependent DNA helicase RecG
MTESDLFALLSEIEGERLEVTTSTKDSQKFGRAICAFANDLPNSKKPGFLIIGVDDKSLRPAGISITDQLLRTLADIRSSGNVLPIPSVSVERVSTSEGDVAVVRVEPSPSPPVRFEGVAWIRTGPRKDRATPEEERRLTERATAGALTFDALPCLGASDEDIDFRSFQIEYLPLAVNPDVLAENGRPVHDQMASLRLWNLDQHTPTNAGVLLFGRDSRYYMPFSYVQFLRIPGVSLAVDPVDQREINMPLAACAKSLVELVDLHNIIGIRDGGMFRDQDVPLYPRNAIREILMNALIHADYQITSPIRFYWFDDRIEISNPGGLYTLRDDEYLRTTAYRNPILSEAMRTYNYVNRFGRGIHIAVEALRREGHPQPSFEFKQNFSLVTIYGRS